MCGKKDAVFKMCDSLGIQLTVEDKELVDKKLIKIIMQKWLNAAKACLEMIIMKLPSPKVSQA